MSTKSELILKFHLWCDDSTDLSDDEESDLFDEKYQEICTYKPWEFTKKQFSGVQSTTLPYVALSSDFQYLIENNNHTENNAEASLPVVFVGTSFSPYKVINYSDRQFYVNKDGYCYIDIVNMRLVFTKQPTVANAIIYDYSATMPDLADGGTPVFPARFHQALFYAMCVDDSIIQQSDKAKSYQGEYQGKYDSKITDMEYWNAKLIQI